MLYIVGTIIYSGLNIKPGAKLLRLNDSSKATLRNRLTEVSFLIIDELSIDSSVSSNLWRDIDSRLGEIFMMILEKVFAGISIMTVADLVELSPIRGKLIFLRFFDKKRNMSFIRFEVIAFI